VFFRPLIEGDGFASEDLLNTVGYRRQAALPDGAPDVDDSLRISAIEVRPCIFVGDLLEADGLANRRADPRRHLAVGESLWAGDHQRFTVVSACGQRFHRDIGDVRRMDEGDLAVAR